MAMGNKQQNNAIIARMKAELGVGSDIELAQVLGIRSQGISKARLRKIPEGWIDAVAAKTGCSRESLLTGKGSIGIVGIDDQESAKTGAMHPEEDLLREDMLAGIERLKKIYESGDLVLIRAINASLAAFSGSVDNKKMATDADAKYGEVMAKLDKLSEEFLAHRNEHQWLKTENDALRRRLGGNGEKSEAVGG